MKKNLLIPLFAAFVACTAPAGETAENLVYSLNAVIASKGEKFAVSDSTGKLHSGYVYDELEGLPNNFLLARQGEEYLILNGKGEKVGVRGYDTFEYCFNGCALVTADGKWGLVTTSGVEILQPEYDRIVFMASELVAAEKGAFTDVVDINGRLIYRVESSLDEVVAQKGKYCSMYEMKLYGEEAWWNTVLDSYDSLSVKCRNAKILLESADGLPQGYMEELVAAAARIKGELENGAGRMTDAQIRRFLEIQGSYGN